MENFTLSIIVDNEYITITSIPTAGKLLPNKVLNVVYSSYPQGINWRWDFNNIITNQYSSNPQITTPSTDGSYRLLIIITNSRGEAQNALTFNYYIDGTAPVLNPTININNILPAGIVIPFSNVTDLDIKTFNFTWVGSGVYTSSFPILGGPAGLKQLWASVSDELGNTRTQTYTIHAKIGILSLSPSQAGKPGQQMKITLSETPDISSYEFYFSNNTLYYQNGTAPKLPDRVGNYILKITLRDTLANWDNSSYNIAVDNTPPNFLSVSPLNNSIIYDIATPIVVTFDDNPTNFFFTFDGVTNNTGIILIPNPAAYYNITIYASDLALNWVTVHLSFYRYYRPVISPTNSSDILLNSTLNLTLNFPYDNIVFKWDYNMTNSSLSYIPNISGKHLLNVTIANGNIISSTLFIYYVKIYVTSIFKPSRLKGNSRISVNFSESSAIYSYKWEYDTLWRFGVITSPTTDGIHILSIKMTTKDYTKEYTETFNYYIDNTPPTITAITPLTTNVTPTITNSGRNVSIYYSDSNCIGSCISAIRYYWNDVRNNVSLSNYNDHNASLGTIPANTTSNTAMSLIILITDKANNTNIYNFTYIIDDFPPNLVTNIYNGDTVTIPFAINLNVSEPSSMNISIQFTDNGDTINKFFNIASHYKYIPVIYGNHTLDIYIKLTDTKNNSRTILYTINTVDPAILVNFNTHSINTSAPLNFTVSKSLKYQRVDILLENGTIFKTFNELNSTVPNIPNYEGPINIRYYVEDYQQTWYNGSRTFIFDSLTPRVTVTANRLINGSLIRQDTFFQSQIGDVLNGQTLFVNITDRYGFNGTIHFEYIQNDTRMGFDYKVVNQTSMTFDLPRNATDFGELVFYLSNGYGKILDFTINFDIVSIPSTSNASTANNGSNDMIIQGVGTVSIICLLAIVYKKRSFIKDKIKKETENVVEEVEDVA